MFLLALTPDEKLIIYILDNEYIQILVTEAQPGLMRLGIEAPPNYIILRDELFDTDES